MEGSSEETAKQRLENFLGALSNSGPAVRLYPEGTPEYRHLENCFQPAW